MQADNVSRTALVIPVPEVRAASGPAGAAGRIPTITLIDRFLPRPAVDDGVLGELEDFFAALTPFAYVVGEPTRFPDGMTYLPPQPLAPFRRIVAELRRDFPEIAGGTTLEEVAPHLIAWEGAGTAPIPAVAREAQLLGGPGLEDLVATFAFGTSAA